MSFETAMMKFVERMLIFGRKREATRHPENLPDIDQAIDEIRAERAGALDRDIARKQADRADLD